MPLTLALAEAAARPQPLTDRSNTIVRLALLDVIGVTFAGAVTPQARIVADELARGGGAGGTVIGRARPLAPLDAALANGTAAHALDFDDVNMAIPGHPSAVLFPAIMAAAELFNRPTSGERFVAAYAAGYDIFCRLGNVLTVEHYDRGFHATASLGGLAAAAACANLMGLAPVATGHALGIAATQASGLKAMFGTMTKPFNAGHAARSGLLAARLAYAGLESRDDAVEHEQGLGVLYAASPDFAADHGPRVNEALADNLFKYHAACYLVHAAIDAVTAMQDEVGFMPADVVSATIRADRSLDNVCNIEHPRTGNEAKFSLRAAVALRLAQRDTARIESFEAFAEDAEAKALMTRTEVRLQDGWSKNVCEVELRLRDGRTLVDRRDSSVANPDLAAVEARLSAKFRALVEPLAGLEHASAVADALTGLPTTDDVRPLIRLCASKGETA